MKISSTECGKAAANAAGLGKTREKILPKDMPRHKTREKAAAHLTPLEQGILAAEEALKDIPDVREEIVEEIRARIKQGDYRVSGEDVADMMMRRRAADRLR